MNFVKSHWVSILIILLLGGLLWMQYNKTKKLEAAAKVAAGTAAGFMADESGVQGYDASGIGAGLGAM